LKRSLHISCAAQRKTKAAAVNAARAMRFSIFCRVWLFGCQACGRSCGIAARRFTYVLGSRRATAAGTYLSFSAVSLSGGIAASDDDFGVFSVAGGLFDPLVGGFDVLRGSVFCGGDLLPAGFWSAMNLQIVRSSRKYRAALKTASVS
jgi:hypothetical protein